MKKMKEKKDGGIMKKLAIKNPNIIIINLLVTIAKVNLVLCTINVVKNMSSNLFYLNTAMPGQQLNPFYFLP